MLKPGESSTIDVSFTMNSTMGGPHHFIIPVESNDPERPTVELSIKADFGPYGESGGGPKEAPK